MGQTFFWNGDHARLNRDQLDEVSPYLSHGARSEAGQGPAFVGSIRDGWLALEASDRILAANDLVAAWGGVKWLQEHDLAIDVIAGPATDNAVGTRYIIEELGVGAANARVEPKAFVDLVEEAAFTKTKA